MGGIGDDTIVLQNRFYGQQTVSFDDVVVNGVIDGVDTILNFQGDVVDSTARRSEGRYPSPQNDQQDRVDLRDLMTLVMALTSPHGTRHGRRWIRA